MYLVNEGRAGLRHSVSILVLYWLTQRRSKMALLHSMLDQVIVHALIWRLVSGLDLPGQLLLLLKMYLLIREACGIVHDHLLSMLMVRLTALFLLLLLLLLQDKKLLLRLQLLGLLMLLALFSLFPPAPMFLSWRRLRPCVDHDWLHLLGNRLIK